MGSPGHVYAQRMRQDLAKPGLEMHLAICQNEMALLRQLVASPPPNTKLKADSSKPVNLSMSRWGPPLHIAVYCDTLEAVEVLLGAGADPEADPHDDTPWVLAAQLGRREILQRFWSWIPIHREEPSFHGRVSDCLIRAARHGHVLTVEDMLNRELEWSEPDITSALCAATFWWQDNVAEMLLDRMVCPVSALNKALVIACQPRFAAEQSENSYEEEDDSLRQEKLVASLIRAGAEPNASRDRDRGLPLVHLTARLAALIGGLNALLENGSDPDILDEYRRSALHVLAWPVCQLGQRGYSLNYASAEMLVKHGASVLCVDELGNTPLHYAASGSDLRLFTIYASACTPLQLGEALQTQNYAGETSLHWAAAGSKQDILEHLVSLSKGSDINLANHAGWTPLMCAAAGVGTASETARAVAFLLDHGAHPGAERPEGWNALHALARHFDDDTDSQLGQVAERVIVEGELDVDKKVSQLPRPDSYWRFHNSWPGGNGFSFRPVGQDLGASSTTAAPLHWAAEFGSLGVARAVLAHGADPLARNGEGKLSVELAYTARGRKIRSDALLTDEVVQMFFGLVRDRIRKIETS